MFWFFFPTRFLFVCFEQQSRWPEAENTENLSSPCEKALEHWKWNIFDSARYKSSFIHWLTRLIFHQRVGLCICFYLALPPHPHPPTWCIGKPKKNKKNNLHLNSLCAFLKSRLQFWEFRARLWLEKLPQRVLKALPCEIFQERYFNHDVRKKTRVQATIFQAAF